MHASVADPLKDVRMLFERAGCPVSCGGSDWGAQAHFEALLSDPVVRAQVPCLNSGNIDLVPTNGLCRFRGMVQETLDTEVYAGAYECAGGGVATTKFRDCLAAPPAAGAQPYLWERRPLYCVRVPGEAAWAAGGAAASAPPISAAPAALVQRACPC